MSTHSLRRALATFSCAMIALLSACDAVVGAECAPGYVECAGRCVDLLADPDHCGSCGATCAEGICTLGMCGLNPPPDGGLPDADLGRGDAALPDGAAADADLADGATDDAALADGATDDAALADGATDDADLADGATDDADLADGATDDADLADGAIDDGAIDALDGDVATDLGGADPDAATFDAGTFDGGGIDASSVDAGRTDMSDPDAGPIVCDLGELLCSGVCVRPDRDPLNCGTCGLRCAVGDLCVDGMCTPLCEAPLSFCSGFCVDFDTDPDHCGSCGARCPSGLCTDGMCVDAPAGHIVVIGHDYVTRRVGMSRIAGNAIFLGSGNPVRVLAYEGTASGPSISGTNAAISQVATARGRPWLRTTALAAEVPLRLASSDVFLLYAQGGADDAALRSLGVMWSVALRTFLQRGGVVVVLETVGESGGTWQVLEAAGLFTAVARAPLTTGTLRVMTPGDAVAIDVPLMYSVERNTVRFDSSDGTIVVADSVGAVVLHRVVTGP